MYICVVVASFNFIIKRTMLSSFKTEIKQNWPVLNLHLFKKFKKQDQFSKENTFIFNNVYDTSEFNFLFT